jgi:hypothetical protein
MAGLFALRCIVPVARVATAAPFEIPALLFGHCSTSSLLGQAHATCSVVDRGERRVGPATAAVGQGHAERRGENHWAWPCQSALRSPYSPVN